MTLGTFPSMPTNLEIMWINLKVVYEMIKLSRCNVGGGTVCHMTCVLMGYSEGSCGEDYNCNCAGSTRWGNVIETVQNRI